MRSRAIFFLLVLAAAGAATWWYLRHDAGPARLDSVAVVSSKDLHGTVIVPTPDTPIPEGKSAIWCASFQMAWDELKNKVVGAPVDLEGAAAVCGRLNASQYDPKNLVPGSYYANAGWVKDGIVATVQADMARQFPQQVLPNLAPDDLTVAVAYAYLEAALRFTHRYHTDSLCFVDAAGRETTVHAFGIGSGQSPPNPKLGEQVNILFASENGNAFAVDLDQASNPHRLVLACVPRSNTINECWKDVQQRIAAAQPGTPLFLLDRLAVPKMNWNVEHHVTEVKRKNFRNPALDGRFIRTALQSVRFRLDESGVEMRSQAHLDVAKSAQPPPRKFLFNRPYLIAMTRRGSDVPYFLMWVDNAELMDK